MAYYIDLFSPETYRAFSDSAQNISGVRERQRATASGIRPGDKFICYMTKLSRWIGVLEVSSDFFVDDQPIFTQSADPFVIRFHVSSAVWLEPKHSIPISDSICWKHLSFTRDLHRNSTAWTGMVRSSLKRLSDEDGQYLEKLLTEQAVSPKEYPLTPSDRGKMQPSVINSEIGQITVSIPDPERDPAEHRKAVREHAQMQAKIAQLGDLMGFQIWLPLSDRQRVLEEWQPSDSKVLLRHLPLNYDNVTLRIIENIDVLWIRRKSIIRAFEIEHSTAIYSGLLRMADLMSLQPNLNIKAHIVAPSARRGKVLQEISRPVFALMESGPMSESCSYFSYESVAALCGERNLSHMNDSVLEDYVEYAQDADF